MKLTDMSIKDLEKAIIEKFGEGKSAFHENYTQFVFLCEAHSDDPLVIEYDRKLDKCPTKGNNNSKEKFLESIGRCR